MPSIMEVAVSLATLRCAFVNRRRGKRPTATVHSALLVTVVLALAAPARAEVCSAWPDCDTGLTLNATPEPGHPTFVLDAETEHFALFVDPASAYAGQHDPARRQTLEDQLECAYRYFVCELGRSLPYGEKTQVYLSNVARAPASGTYLEVLEVMVTNNAAYDTSLITQPVHEFFHRLAFSGGSYNSYQGVSEGLATLAEQMCSSDNLDNSLAQSTRLRLLTEPEWERYGYGMSLFYRYLFERLTGNPSSPSDIDEDWAVREQIGPALDELATNYNEDQVSFLSNLFASQWVAGVSTAATLDEVIEDFQTARYAFDFVNPRRTCRLGRLRFPQWRYSFPNRAKIGAAATLVPYASGVTLAPGDLLNLQNLATNYGGGAALNDGFQNYLGAEYHVFSLDPAVTALRFIESPYVDDPEVRYQLIVRANNDCVYARPVLATLADETVPIPAAGRVTEVVFVVYSVNHNPVTTLAGQFFDVEIEVQ